MFSKYLFSVIRFLALLGMTRNNVDCHAVLVDASVFISNFLINQSLK